MTTLDDVTTVDPPLLRGWPLPRPGSDKESRGTILVVGGTTRTPGAVLLAGEAALRAGAGKLQIATVDPVVAALGVAMPEAMVLGMPATEGGDIDPASADAIHGWAAAADVTLLGPGCWDEGRCVELSLRLLSRMPECRVVLDAVATVSLRERPGGLLSELDSVVTVNPGELGRALGREPIAAEDQVAATRDLAEREQTIVLCGGEDKVVAGPDGRAWRVRAGGPGLGVSGSGDVQAGLVAGLLARGAEPAQAAVWGAYLHGRAGELLTDQVGTVGFLAREVAGRATEVMSRLDRGEGNDG